MTGASFEKRTAYIALGGGGVFLAAGYLGMSLQLPFGEFEQPGAAVFPILAGSLLLIGSISALIEGWRMGKADRIEVPTGPDLRRLAGLMALLLAYFLLLPWLGQLICSTLFCIALMRLLSKLSWLSILLRSVAITVTSYFIFIYLLNVPMPRGLHF